MNIRKLFLNLLFLIVTTAATAQISQPLPVDKQIRKGKLDNGLTYYIRHNEYPKKQAEFYIAQKVGSILEDDNQQGLAHFLEHMCFNGTKNFPGKTMINYLEGIGVKFGENLNAYTSIDETVYNISNVPVSRTGVVDSCLLILHDWANGLSLEPKEIDSERGVIHEEWRTRSNAALRIFEKALPTIVPNSKYAYRLPIGKMEIVDNFPYKDLRNYYKKWYRPDLQGIMIVGDVDVEYVEKQIKAVFGQIKMPKNPAKREYEVVADNDQTIYDIESDKEQNNSGVQVFYKYNPISSELKQTSAYYTRNFLTAMTLSMLNSRLGEMITKKDAPFISASIDDGNYILCKDKNAYTASVMCKDNEITKGLTALLVEIERAKKYGFLQSEYDRALNNFINQLESTYRERGKITNNQYVEECVNNFLNDDPVPGIDLEHTLLMNISQKMGLNEINRYIKMLFRETNRVVLATIPQKEGIEPLSKEMLASCFDNAKNCKIEQYQDLESKEPLLSKEPVGGKVVKKVKGIYQSNIYTLSNGVKIVVKPTDYKADQISFTAFSPGGSSQYPNCDPVNIMTLSSVSSLGGYGTFDRIALDKKLSGKQVSCGINITSRTEEASGSCINRDLETMLQLLYLQFTSPRKDMEAFEIYKKNIKLNIEKSKGLPMTIYRDSLQKALYMDHPLAKSMTAEMVDRIDYDKILDMYKDRLKDASDFTFVFVGNIDEKVALPLFEKYIGGLPSTNRKEKAKDIKLEVREGKYSNIFRCKMETPKATVSMFIHGSLPYTQTNLIKMNALSQVLNTLFLNEIREKESGTYGVQISGNISQYPVSKATLNINFETNHAICEKMTKKIVDELHAFVSDGYEVKGLKEVKEFMLKNHTLRINKNAYWMNIINNYYQNDIDMYNNYEKIVNDITEKDLKNMCKEILEQNNTINVTMWDE